MAQGPEIKLLEAVEDNILPWLDHVVEINSDGPRKEEDCLGEAKLRHFKDLLVYWKSFASTLRNWKHCSLGRKADAVVFITRCLVKTNILKLEEELCGAAAPLAKANRVLWHLCEAAPEDPSEYGRIRRHCVTFYKDCLTGLQAFFDLCSNASLQKYGSDIYERLRDALAALDDLTARWWRVLTLPKGHMTQMSKDLEASRQRLREMLSCAEDLSNVAREIFTYSGSFLTVVNISLSDLYIDVCSGSKAAPPYDDKQTKTFIKQFLKERKTCKEQFTEANLGKQFKRVSKVLKILDNEEHESKSAKGRGEALDVLKMELEDSSKVILTDADHERFASMFKKDWEDIEMKILESSDVASGTTSRGYKRGKKHEKAQKGSRTEISIGLRTAVIAFGANWLLHHCRPKSECADAAVEGQELGEEANCVSNASAVRTEPGELQEKEVEQVQTKSVGIEETPSADKPDDAPSAKGRQEEGFVEGAKGTQGFLQTNFSVEEAAALLDMYSKYLQDSSVQDNSPSQALSPFLPLLPGFLIGVRLSAAEWPSHDIEGFLDVTSDSDVNLHTLVEELGVQAEAAPADRTHRRLVEDVHSFSRTVRDTWSSVGPYRNAAGSVEDLQTLGLALLDLGIAVCRLWKALLGSTAALPGGRPP